MSDHQFHTGWQFDGVAYDRLMYANDANFSAWGAPPPNYGAGQRVMHYRVWTALGMQYPIFRNQTWGTCVGRGMARSFNYLAAMKALETRAAFPGMYSSEAAYATARIEIGRNVHNQPPPDQGASVSNGVEAMMKYGLPLRGTKYSGGTIPLVDDDKLAAQWGSSRQGMPDDLEPIAKQFVVRSFLPLRTANECRDFLVANLGIIIFGTDEAQWPRRSNSQYLGTRDKDGFLRYSDVTAHCWLCVGVADDIGEPYFVLENGSWAGNADGTVPWINGPKGGLEDMPDYCYKVPFSVMDRIIKGRGRFPGECFGVSDLSGLDKPRSLYMLI